MLPPSGLLSGRYGGNTACPHIVGLIDIPAELVYRLIKALGTHIFREYYGMTPQQYRRRFK